MGSGGGGIPGNASLTDQFLWQPGNDSCSWYPVEGGVGREKMCIFCILCLSFQSMTLLSSPFSPPNPTPLCVDVQKKRIVFQVTLSNHPPSPTNAWITPAA